MHRDDFKLCFVVKYSLSSLMFCPGDIGGQMGLFIGASILTVLELFDYLYEVKSLKTFSIIITIGHRSLTWNTQYSVLLMQMHAVPL